MTYMDRVSVPAGKVAAALCGSSRLAANGPELAAVLPAHL